MLSSTAEEKQHSDNTQKHFILLRPTLLLENYRPWLDLKVHSKVDASIAEVPQWKDKSEWFYPRMNT